jgi:hypothetical protein
VRGCRGQVRLTHSHPLGRICRRRRAHEYLERLRPACLPALLREKLSAVLPFEGDVGPPPQKVRGKLAALDSVLEYHGRKSVYEVKARMQ